MMKTVKRIAVLLLLVVLMASFITPALAHPPRGIVPTKYLPDGIVGEPYSYGHIRPKYLPADTTWDIWEGQPPPPIWSIALYERGLDQWFSPDYSHSNPWDLPMIEDVWYGTLPPGLYLDQFGGLIFGTPTTRGEYTFYASAFLPDGVQVHVPYHAITIRERLETPVIDLRTAINSVIDWEAVPRANGYLIYVNGVYAHKIGAVTSFDLEELNLAEGPSGHYINLIAVNTDDDLFLNSYSSNSERFIPKSPGDEVYGSPDHHKIHLSAYTHTNARKVPQTSIHDTNDSFIAMCISIAATLTLSVCVFIYIRGIRKNRG